MLGIIDEVLSEPLGGAHRNPQQVSATMKEAIIRHLDELATIPADQLVRQRLARFRKIGDLRSPITSFSN